MSIKDAARRFVGNDRPLEERVAALEAQMDENRRLNERLSDLLDLTAELLLPEDRRNDERLNRLLDKVDPGSAD